MRMKIYKPCNRVTSFLLEDVYNVCVWGGGGGGGCDRYFFYFFYT